jgi:glutamyl-tRNA reductase
MRAEPSMKSQEFYCVGISYKKAEADMRGGYSLSIEGQELLMQDAYAAGVQALTIISTCNRTEVYAFASSADFLIDLICRHTEGDSHSFRKICYIYVDDDARNHMFRVGTGLDSQILGDFEIIGQLKQCFRRSKSYGLLNPYLERLANSVIQASKRIKTETDLSSGATSVSFASVQYILDKYGREEEKKILLFGTGKIGRNTCDNLVKHTRNKEITLINRTIDRAQDIAGKFNVRYKDYSQLEEEIAGTDILIVATGAQRPTISKSLINTTKPLLILDLSIPHNVNEDVLEMPNVELVQLDKLSRLTNQAISARGSNIPKAEQIIREIHADFKQWLTSRNFAPTMDALKRKLAAMKEAEIKSNRTKINGFNPDQADLLGDRIIQKIAGHIANHLREDHQDTDEVLRLIQKVFKLEDTNV